MTALEPQLLLATALDDRFPATNVVDADEKTFFLTTGMYPHELLFAFKDDAAVDLGKIELVSHGVKKIRVERCTERVATQFDSIVDCDVADSADALQREQFSINKETVGSGVKFVKIIILAGHGPFSAVHTVKFSS
jgi:heat shock protein beta-11